MRVLPARVDKSGKGGKVIREVIGEERDGAVEEDIREVIRK